MPNLCAIDTIRRTQINKSFGIMLCIFGLLSLVEAPAQAQTVLSEFSGSQLLGLYTADYDQLIVVQDNGDTSKLAHTTVEGKLASRVYNWPEGKTLVEIRRNYEQVLAQNDFEIVTVIERPKGLAINQVRGANRGNRINDRAYKPRPQGSTLDRVVTFVDHYLLAQRTEQSNQRYVVLLINERDQLYAIDELVIAGMQTGMVVITEDALQTGLQQDGKIAIYDIFFATGSASIEDTSNKALDVIGNFLNSNPSINIYVVGHTDDTGSYQSNIRLAEQRADAVAASLISRFGVTAERLRPHGVGPLVPIASNTSDAGRQQNRRVELVQRLE